MLQTIGAEKFVLLDFPGFLWQKCYTKLFVSAVGAH